MVGIIAGSMYSALRIGFKARTSAEAAVEPARTAGLATALLREDFESARPAAGTLSGPFVGTDTTGDGGGACRVRRVHREVSAQVMRSFLPFPASADAGLL